MQSNPPSNDVKMNYINNNLERIIHAGLIIHLLDDLLNHKLISELNDIEIQYVNFRDPIHQVMRDE